MNHERIARVAHEVNRGYCQSIGDPVAPPWEQASEEMRISALRGVEMYAQNPDTSPEQAHVNWMTDKFLNGWIYGPVKDEEKREHPCMVQYSELPEKQKAKDYIFRSTVTSLLRYCGDE